GRAPGDEGLGRPTEAVEDRPGEGQAGQPGDLRQRGELPAHAAPGRRASVVVAVLLHAIGPGHAATLPPTRRGRRNAGDDRDDGRRRPGPPVRSGPTDRSHARRPPPPPPAAADARGPAAL